MVKRIAPVVCFVLLAAFAAVCQNARHSLPDAPSVQAATYEYISNGFVEAERSLSKVGPMEGYAGVMRQGGFAAAHKTVFGQEERDANGSDNIFRKYLYPSSQRRQLSYRSSSSGSWIGRATHAASRPLITRSDSGKARLNTSYLLRTLTSIAKDTASTPYWRRSLGQPFGDFGSTVGNDAGMDLWHEFGPAIEQLMKSHAPKFVAKIADRVGHH